MALLIAGVVFWGIVHLMPAIAPGVRASLAAKLGEGPFKGLFAVDIVIALALIVFGWKAASPTVLYVPPLYGSPIPSALLALAVLLFVASNTPNNLKRYVRHPQMTAVLLWSVAHLLSNGDSRSVVLFAGLGLWSGLEILFINRRDGEWRKPAAAALANDLVTVVLAILVFTGLAYFHATLFGVAAIPA
jgi:uncharacterized membrane protein